VAGQVVIILAATRFARLALPLTTLLALAAAVAATNAGLHLWLHRGDRRISDAWAGSILAFDMAQLTALLYVTGGAANPFSVFYLVQITAAAATLGSRWTWLLTALGVSAYAGLFAMPPQSAADGGIHAAHDFARHLQTMWVALTLAAALTAFFVTRLATRLAQREAEILAMREAAARRERLSALTTLAAGAAHELATPLTTVAVVAGELEHALSALPAANARELSDDARLIRAEVTRCREILDEIGTGSGNASGEMPSRFAPGDLAADVLARLRAESAPRVDVRAADEGTTLFLPRRALARVVLSLVRNGLDASPPGTTVTLRLSTGAALEIVVEDRGQGMTPDVVSRAGEPFFTTKPPGQGLGLGLFLARSLGDQLGGSFAIDSAPGRGTRVTLRLPLQVQTDVQPG
jgi:two-component system, sensor histidine kinase RegB